MRSSKNNPKILHYNNALWHTLLAVQQCLTRKNFPIITQLLYSLELTLSDVWLLPTLKMGLKGTCFARTGHQIQCDGQTLEDPERNLLTVLPTMLGSREQVHVRVQWSYFESE
jgi:hypothetical protein